MEWQEVEQAVEEELAEAALKSEGQGIAVVEGVEVPEDRDVEAGMVAWRHETWKVRHNLVDEGRRR